MKLRNFMYLNTKILEDYISVIDGFTYDEESQEIQEWKNIRGKKAKEAVDGFSALGQLREGKEISCVFNFEDGKYPLVAYLDQSYFRCSEDNFVGESYLLCKIIRKVQKGQSVKLDEIFGDVKNFR